MILSASLEQTLLFLPFSLGLLLSYRIARLTDLTVESSFLMGPAIFVNLLAYMPTWLALVFGAMGGLITGGFVSLIQNHDRMTSLMAGIISVFMFFSINLLIMGRPHIPVTVYMPVWINGVIVSMIVIFLYTLLRSQVGLKLKAFGDNSNLFQELFHKKEAYRTLALCISNILACVSGLLTTLHQGYIDLYMNQGLSLLGIGTVLVAGALITESIVKQVLACAFVVFSYFFSSHMFLMLDVSTIYLRLLIGVVLIAMLRSKS